MFDRKRLLMKVGLEFNHNNRINIPNPMLWESFNDSQVWKLKPVDGKNPVA